MKIFEHVYQKKCVDTLIDRAAEYDLLIGRQAELVLAIVYVRENVLIC